MRSLISNNKGFSLVEMLLAVAISVLLMGGMMVAIQASTYATRTEEKKVTGQQDVRAVLGMMAMEIAMASYNPTQQSVTRTDFWLDTSCANSLNPTYKGIQEATDSALTVEMDIDGSTWIMGAGENNEVIRYVYNTADQYITRSTNCGAAQPFLGDTTASGRPRSVYVINNTLNIPMFTYWDATGTQIVAPVTANIPNIRRIDITLAVETDDPNANKRQRMIYSTSVIPRNHGITY